MTLQKPHRIRQFSTRFTLFSFMLAISISGLFFIAPGVRQASASTAGICSNVFAPLPTWLTTAVANNQNTYLQVMNTTGVPWQLLAAIHYRETNLSLTEPGNGQGLFQDGYAATSGGQTLSSSQFTQETLHAAQLIQSDYVFRNSPNPAGNVNIRTLTANEQDINLIKNTLYSWNGRASSYAQQAATYGYNSSVTPYEGSPYVMNMFDCPRAGMGIITQDGGAISGTDTRYGAFTLFARLRGDSYWLAMTQPYSWIVDTQELYNDPSHTLWTNTNLMGARTTYYAIVTVRNLGSATWTNSGSNPVDMGATNPQDRSSAFCNQSWLSCNRPARLIEPSVAPGELGTFEFSITPPASSGTYKESFNLLSEGNTWMNDIGMYYQFAVVPLTSQWQEVSQQIYTDSSYTLPANPAALSPDTHYYVHVGALNTGNTTWTNSGSNPVHLGTSHATDRISAFCDPSWINCNRPAALDQASVAPGQIGTFSFAIKTPASYGIYSEYFNPVVEGSAWMNDIGMYLPLNVSSPVSLWQYEGQSAYTDNTKTAPFNMSQVGNGARFYVTLSALNTGNTTWTNSGSNPVHLGTSHATDRISAFCDPSWINCNRPAALDQASVAPGQIGTFSFWMQAPDSLNSTAFSEHFTPVVEGSMWMNDLGAFWPVTMQSSLTAWQYMGQSTYSDSAYQNTTDLTNATVNTTYYLQLKAKNTSGAVWTSSGNNPLRLGTSGSVSSAFCTTGWIGSGCNRMAILHESSVAPGQTGTFDFPILTPSSPINTKLYAIPVSEGAFWLDNIGLYWPIVTH
jgi:hypothetical protein